MMGWRTIQGVILPCIQKTHDRLNSFGILKLANCLLHSVGEY